MDGAPAAAALPPYIHVLSGYSYGQASRLIGGSSTPVATTWVANLAMYIPFTLPWPFPVRRIAWINGSTITSSNVDVGIYDADGVRLFNTGSTAMSGASSAQYAVLGTPLLLGPGRFYMAWACDNTTSRAFAQALAANTGRFAGLLQEQLGSLALPATMTPAAYAGQGVPFMAISRLTANI